MLKLALAFLAALSLSGCVVYGGAVVQPAPVYVHPRPVYVQPAPVYVYPYHGHRGHGRGHGHYKHH